MRTSFARRRPAQRALLRAVEEATRPQLERHQAPDRQRVIAAPVDVLADDGVHGLLVEPAALDEAAIAEQLLHRRLERAAEPLDDGHAEAALGTRQDLGR